MKMILFACVQSAGRSQMAAGFFNSLVNPSEARAVSAGTRPTAHVHPEVVEVMKEVGIDLSRAAPRLLTFELASEAELLITMRCGDACPAIPGLSAQDWPLPDPAGKDLETVRQIREIIRNRVQNLVTARRFQSRG